jgi:hypothetical protein
MISAPTIPRADRSNRSMARRINLPTRSRQWTVVRGDARVGGPRDVAAPRHLAAVCDEWTAHQPIPKHLYAPKILEAEIRCYVRDGKHLSYEIFCFLDDGTSDTGGPFENWADALEQVQQRAARHGFPNLFGSQGEER